MPVSGGSDDWHVIVLELIGATVTNVNYDALQWWAESEGVPASWNNWLATTENCCGGVDVNSVGVKAYPSVADGAQAIANTLAYSAYSAVVRTLRDGNSLYGIWLAINQSPWCGGCQNGLYPVVLWDNVGSQAPPPPPPGPIPEPHFPQHNGQVRAQTAWSWLQHAVGPAAGLQMHRFNDIAAHVKRLRR